MNNRVIIVVSLVSFEILQKVYCERIIKDLNDLIVINLDFVSDYIIGLLMVDGSLIVINYLKGLIYYKYEPIEREFYFGNLMKTGGDMFFNRKSTVYRFIKI